MAKIFLIELDCSKFETMRFLMNPLKTSPKPTMCSFYELVKTFFFFWQKKERRKTLLRNCTHCTTFLKSREDIGKARKKWEQPQTKEESSSYFLTKLSYNWNILLHTTYCTTMRSYNKSCFSSSAETSSSSLMKRYVTSLWRLQRGFCN